ncbi:hypothetical protein ATY41_12070 [Leifsonia xyli subsp. xyli]|uniref:DUF1697 domain-containing protein n=1 Tax=Leifsonia xyli subsp. xyli TaxID=59736 RepID=A0A1E2SJ16_LEIXY|nr:DUF1697 domain-containing protein [Leifsonia xyli]ODA89855.1 hypothetical protein ATY41_12070 [Leifsonia xyli subsp. xyli]
MLGVGLVRGINVGGSACVSKADLAAAFEAAGFAEVVTLLQSGNAVFAASAPPTARQAAAVTAALRASTGVEAGVVLLTEKRFRSLAAGNPLLPLGDDESKLMVTVLDHDLPAGLEVPADDEIAPEAVRLGHRAVYQWCPLGVSKSVLPAAFWRAVGPVATARNQWTVGRILNELDRRG